MNKIINCTIAWFVFVGIGQGQLISDPIQQIRLDVIYLASDYLQGRRMGQMGEELAASYIRDRFREIGLQAKGDSSFYVQQFAIKDKALKEDEEGEMLGGKNIVGFLDNGAPTTIAIGAHYDYMGLGEKESMVYNGADDNASGVAAMLHLAEQINRSEYCSNNYLFIAFSGGESGLAGSKYYANHPTVNLPSINYMLNFDMVGRLHPEKKLIKVEGGGTSPRWKDVFPRIVSRDLNFRISNKGLGPSDHASFYFVGVPSLQFSTGLHEDYRQPTDDSEKINFAGIKEIADLALRLIAEVDGEERVELTTEKGNSEHPTAKYKVTLGIRPNYAFAGPGMQIHGVLEDRPAQKAGIEDGDIVLQVGEFEIGTIYDYMDCLGKYGPGDRVPVFVKRGDKKLEIEVEF